MNFSWREGFHPPKGVAADDVAAALDQLKEPSPENLLQASKAKRHVLHGDLWSEGDQVWAQRGRLERCRQILGAVKRVEIIGGKTIEVRAVEFVRLNGEDRWAKIDDILQDKSLCDAYMAGVQNLLEQASAKMSKLRELMKAAA